MSERAIWKFPLVVTDIATVGMPAGAEVLSVQVQDNDPCLWALVDPAATPELRQFRIIGTGHPIDETLGRFLGTVQFYGGRLVFHVFERPAATEEPFNE